MYRRWFFSEAGFFFVEAVISAGYVRILTGRWWKLAYKQIHDNIRTMHEVQSFREGFLLFLFYSILKFRYSDIPLFRYSVNH